MSARTEEWRDLPGYHGWYQVSNYGRLRSFRDPHHKGEKLRKPVLLTPSKTRYGNCRVVIKWGGKENSVQVGRAVALAFIGDIPKGWMVYHKDGNQQNNALPNIGIAPQAELSRKRMAEKTAGWNRKPVLKINRDLTVVEAYPSACAAARANGYRNDAMWRFCSLAIEFSVFAPDDFLYTFDDDKWVRKALQRAKAELDAMNARYNDPCTECYYDLPIEDEPDIDPAALWWSEAPPLRGGALRMPPAFGRSVTA